MTVHAIVLTKGEVQSGMNRQKWAENLILQLDPKHNGRNSWLLNYGIGEEATAIRASHPHRPEWDDATDAAYTIGSHASTRLP